MCTMTFEMNATKTKYLTDLILISSPVKCSQNAVPAFGEITVLKYVQMIILEKNATLDAVVMKHKSVIMCVDACKDWT